MTVLPYDPIQDKGQGHRGLKMCENGRFKGHLLCQLCL